MQISMDFNLSKFLQVTASYVNHSAWPARREISNIKCYVVKAFIKSPGQNICLQSKFNLLFETRKWDEKGLDMAIARNIDFGAILMQGFAKRDAVVTTITSRKTTSYSRSRSSLWTKGETSWNFIKFHDVFIDCGRDFVRPIHV